MSGLLTAEEVEQLTVFKRTYRVFEEPVSMAARLRFIRWLVQQGRLNEEVSNA